MDAIYKIIVGKCDKKQLVNPFSSLAGISRNPFKIAMKKPRRFKICGVKICLSRYYETCFETSPLGALTFFLKGKIS